MAIPSGGPARAEHHCGDGLAREREPLTDWHLLVRRTGEADHFERPVRRANRKHNVRMGQQLGKVIERG
jgi:hypothetical protein